MSPKGISTQEAAAIACVSSTTIRRRLVPIEVLTTHVYSRGDVTSYFYAKKDAEALRDGRPIRSRKHPDPALARKLSEKSVSGAQTARIGREVRTVELQIVIPANTPTCCRRHAQNHVRHEGTNYDEVVYIANEAYHRHNDATTTMKTRLNSRIKEALIEVGRWPNIENCGRSLPIDVEFARRDFGGG